MTIEVLGAAIGQVLVISGIFFYMFRRNAERLDKIIIDVSVIKNIIKNVEKDHDKIILAQRDITSLQSDVHHAHEKIRAFQ